MQLPDFNLISYKLCPYVQRSVIVLLEKNIPFQRTDIDLSNKPAWFTELSPTGKVPLLHIDQSKILFESAVICEYLDDLTPGAFLPSSPLEKAQHKAWIEYGSAILGLIARVYSTPSESEFHTVKNDIFARFQFMAPDVRGPFFSGADFTMVDAVYGPIFRYFDVIEAATEHTFLDGLPSIHHWRAALKDRPSYHRSVTADYPDALKQFIINKKSHLASLLS